MQSGKMREKQDEAQVSSNGNSTAAQKLKSTGNEEKFLTKAEMDHLGNSTHSLPSEEEGSGSFFRSHMMKLEIDELLKETRIQTSSGSKKLAKVKKLLFSVKRFLEKLPPKTYKKLAVSTNRWPAKPFGSKELEFSPPSSCEVVGSFIVNTLVRPFKSIDLQVQIPKSCFHSRDYLNYRYIDKRKQYLAVLALELKKTGLFSKILYERFLCDDLKPILVLYPKKSTGVKGYIIRLFPSISADTFPIRRFAPAACNVRLPIIEESSNLDAPQKLFPTPEYNMRILEDTRGSSCRSHLEVLSRVSSECESFDATVVLIKVWSRQRGICKRSSPDTFNEFLLTMLLCYLLDIRHLSRHLSCQQLFKSLMAYVVENDLSAESAPVLRLGLGKTDPITIQGFEDEAMKSASKLVFMGPCGKLNLAWRVSKSGWEVVREQARTTLGLLDSQLDKACLGGRSNFESLFILRTKYWERFDRCVRVVVPGVPHKDDYSGPDAESIASKAWTRYVWEKVESVFVQGFVATGRASSVSVNLAPSKQLFSTVDDEEASNIVLVVGLNLNLEQAYKILDRGPAADDTVKAAKFRSFWGEKSELRRFKDGSILEAVLWGNEDMDVNGDLCEAISKYLTTMHLSMLGRKRGKSYEVPRSQVIASAFSSIVEKLGYRQSVRIGGSMNAAKELFEAFQTLQIRLKKLNLPLNVREVIGTDPALRYAAAVLPTPHPLAFGTDDKSKDSLIHELEADFSRKVGSKSRRPSADLTVSKFIEKIDVVVRFEISGKWPDDYSAIERMKTAFYIEMASSFDKLFSGSQRCIVSDSFIDILLGGFAFRVRIRNDRQLDLLSGKVEANDIARTAAAVLERRESERKTEGGIMPLLPLQDIPIERRKEMALQLKESMIRLPKLHSQLHALHTNTDSDDEKGGARVMSAVVQLVKLWISGHRLWPCIKEEAIEIIVASLFIHHRPFVYPPRSVFSGFIRFLNLLASFDWKSSPLIVNINNELSEKDVADCMKEFLSQTENNPNRPPMYIITPDDRGVPKVRTMGKEVTEPSWRPFWTSTSQPSAESLNRFVGLAKSSLTLLERLCTEQTDSEATIEDECWEALFRSDIDQSKHDIVLKLNEIVEIPEMVTNLNSENTKKKKREGKLSSRLFKNLARESEKTVLIGVKPIAKYAESLSRNFGHWVQLYYDPFHGRAIGINFRRGYVNPTKFRLAVSAYSKPSQKGNKSETDKDSGNELTISPNVDEMIADLSILGAGLLRSVHIQGENID